MTLRVNSSPFNGLPITIDGVQYTTPATYSKPITNGNNIAPLNSFGDLGRSYGGRTYGFYGDPDPSSPYYRYQITGVSSAIQHNGHDSIFIQSNLGNHPIEQSNNYREVDGPWLDAQPGNHVFVSVWFKMVGYYPDNGGWIGGRIGFDFYGPTAQHPLDGLPSSGQSRNEFSQTPYHTPLWVSTKGVASGANVAGVVWDSDWTQQTYDFIIPDKVYTIDYEGVIDPQQISAIVMWIDARPYNTDSATAYFSDTELYITP